ncbi:MAG TPA: TonB-dependent siderophore receptor [Pyrinomonadaceae bacterium]|nr:TonB-dependent siderophore receptor [Pyrinomonadaceae bacterium]
MFFAARVSGAILLAVFYSLTTFSQSPSTVSPVRGRVVDQNRSAVVAATVKARNVTARSSTSASSDTNGEFSFSLPAGDYVIEVQADGFNHLLQRLRVSSNENNRLELSLEVAPATATVTVSDIGNLETAIVFSGTRTPTALRDIPQTISVVGKQQIADQSFSSISDVVRYQAGISSPQGENNRDQLIIRGQNSSADFFLNGVRDDVQYYRDLYNLESVEILRGPNALVFGRGGGGGVVNRVSKEAGDSPRYEFTAQGGSFGNRRAAFDVNTPVNRKVALRFNGVGEMSNSFRDFVKLRRFGFNPTATINLDSNTRVTVSYDLFRDRRTADRGITSVGGHPVDVPISTFYGDPENSKVRLGANLFTAGVDRVFGSLIFRNRTMYGDYDRFYQNYVPAAVNPLTNLVSLSAYNNQTLRRNLFNQTDFIYNFVTGGIKHTLLGGFEIGRQHSNNFRNSGFFNNTSTAILVPYDHPTTSSPITFRQNATDADNRVHLNLAAAYVQDQIELNRFVQFVLGARFDYFDLKFHNNRTNSDLGRIDRLVSPRFGIVIKPLSQLSLYGNYSVSYLPSSGDQFSQLTSVTQQVKPEKFTNYEVGIKWDIRNDLSLTSAVYRLDRTNTRANHPTDPNIIVQTGSQRTNGFELNMNGNPLRKWTITGGYAFQDAFISSSTTAAVAGKQVAQVPRHSFTLWNKYQVLKRLSAGIGLIRRSDIFASIDNTVVLPAYTRVDAAVFYNFNEHWRLQANMENLLDTRYYQNADNNTNISPGSPRAAKVTLVARF